MAVFGSGQVHAQQKHQMRESIGQRAADHDNGGIAEMHGGNSQKGNQGPANHVA
jgi:hypothetical protein